MSNFVNFLSLSVIWVIMVHKKETELQVQTWCKDVLSSLKGLRQYKVYHKLLLKFNLFARRSIRLLDL